MLSAVANFLFGSQPTVPEPEEAEKKVDYEFKEAEDWLLVDVSDQEELDYDTVDDVADDEDSSDDVLSSLPLFLSSAGMASSSTTDICSSVVYPSCEDSWLVTSSACRITELPDEGFVQVIPTEKRFAEESLWRTSRRSSLFYGLLQSVRSIDFATISCMETSRSVVIRTDKRVPVDSMTSSRTNALATTMTPYTHKSKQAKQDKRYRQLAEPSKAFINHQSPFVISKTELLEQIKQLKPAQQAKEQDLKKHIKKSQLNRQNKTYQYESTNKNKRRKDFYQRHSGANNNRKC